MFVRPGRLDQDGGINREDGGFDGPTRTQIASLLHLPLGTAKGRIHNGLTRLRRELTP